MSDHTDSIHTLQRAARSEGRREASLRVRETRETRGWSHGEALRSRIHAIRDTTHYHGLRIGELFATRSQRTRRTVGGATAASLLLIVVLTSTAGAGADRERSTQRAGTPTPTAPGPRGSRADETLVGSAAADRINGRSGDDVVLAGAGSDILSGAIGNDVLHGGGGDDILFAGPGRDVLIGAAGDDQLRATNLDGERDRLHCGAGNDVAWVVARRGRIEDVTTGCERVNVIDVRTTRRLG